MSTCTATGGQQPEAKRKVPPGWTIREREIPLRWKVKVWADGVLYRPPFCKMLCKELPGRGREAGQGWAQHGTQRCCLYIRSQLPCYFQETQNWSREASVEYVERQFPISIISPNEDNLESPEDPEDPNLCNTDEHVEEEHGEEEGNQEEDSETDQLEEPYRFLLDRNDDNDILLLTNEDKAGEENSGENWDEESEEGRVPGEAEEGGTAADGEEGEEEEGGRGGQIEPERGTKRGRRSGLGGEGSKRDSRGRFTGGGAWAQTFVGLESDSWDHGLPRPNLPPTSAFGKGSRLKGPSPQRAADAAEVLELLRSRRRWASVDDDWARRAPLLAYLENIRKGIRKKSNQELVSQLEAAVRQHNLNEANVTSLSTPMLEVIALVLARGPSRPTSHEPPSARAKLIHRIVASLHSGPAAPDRTSAAPRGREALGTARAGVRPGPAEGPPPAGATPASPRDSAMPMERGARRRRRTARFTADPDSSAEVVPAGKPAVGRKMVQRRLADLSVVDFLMDRAVWGVLQWGSPDYRRLMLELKGVCKEQGMVFEACRTIVADLKLASEEVELLSLPLLQFLFLLLVRGVKFSRYLRRMELLEHVLTEASGYFLPFKGGTSVQRIESLLKARLSRWAVLEKEEGAHLRKTVRELQTCDPLRLHGLLTTLSSQRASMEDWKRASRPMKELLVALMKTGKDEILHDPTCPSWMPEVLRMER